MTDLETISDTFCTTRIQHPFFGIQPSTSPDLQTVRLLSYGATFRLQLIKQFLSDADPTYDSIMAAEDAFFSDVLETKPRDYPIWNMADWEADIRTGNYPGLVDVYAAFQVMIRRESSKIAQRTRRGYGNICIMNRTGIDLLRKGKSPFFIPGTKEDRGDSNLRFVGMSNNIQIYRHINWGYDKPAIVLYKGSNQVDLPAALSSFTKDGKLHYRISKQSYNFPDYFGFVGMIA